MSGEIISIVILISAMALFPVFLQLTAYQGINDNYFKRIKIRRFKFLFKAIDWQSAAKRGVIIPMLVVQISGYILALISIILTIILVFAINVDNRLQITVIVNGAILGIEIIAAIVTVIITSIVSRKREENNYIPKKK